MESRTNSSPLISIVTPSFNQATFVEEALLSVRNQGVASVEHIVVDGGSKDHTVEVLKRYSLLPGEVTLRWISEPDRGQSDALNKGFRMARGQIVGWLNSDDLYRPDCFRAVLQSFQQNPAVDVLYGDYRCVDARGQLLRLRREIEFSHFILRYHRVLYVPTPSTFFRRRIFDEGNLIDIQYHYAMDYEFFLRLAERGYRFKHVRRFLADFRIHEQSKTGSQAFRQLEEHNQIAQIYAPGLRRLPPGLPRRSGFLFLRGVAGSLRYIEKLYRGYYFAQLFPSYFTAE